MRVEETCLSVLGEERKKVGRAQWQVKELWDVSGEVVYVVFLGGGKEKKRRMGNYVCVGGCACWGMGYVQVRKRIGPFLFRVVLINYFFLLLLLLGEIVRCAQHYVVGGGHVHMEDVVCVEVGGKISNGRGVWGVCGEGL